MIFILKLTINMELIDTPNPNAKKIEIEFKMMMFKNVDKIRKYMMVFLQFFRT